MRRFNDTKKQFKEGEQKMKHSFSKKFLSVFLCITLIMTYLPISVMAASASSDHISRVSDPSTMDNWQDFFLPDGKISTENAGGVWMDKSVFTDLALKPTYLRPSQAERERAEKNDTGAAT